MKKALLRGVVCLMLLLRSSGNVVVTNPDYKYTSAIAAL